MLKRIFAVLAIPLLILSCKKDDDGEDMDDMIPTEERSPVVFEPDSVPYPKLSDYRFYAGEMSELEPAIGVLPYDVISPLFSDYSKKKRFVWMPDSVSALYDGDHDILSFQEGTVLLKNFYYSNVQPGGRTRVIETRMEYLLDGEWQFAEYVWNEEQTEAVLDLGGSFTEVNWIDEKGMNQFVNYRIPAGPECLTCHKIGDVPIPIGPKPQNINQDYNYSDGVKNQLLKWEEVGYLNSVFPVNINTTVAWDDTTQLLTDRVRSYLDMNCAHCHREGSHCDYRPIRLAFEETLDPVNLGYCVEPDEFVAPGLSYIIEGSNPDRSALFYRMNSIDAAERMPLLGRTIRHEEGLDLILEYINSLEPC